MEVTEPPNGLPLCSFAAHAAPRVVSLVSAVQRLHCLGSSKKIAPGEGHFLPLPGAGVSEAIVFAD